MKRLYKYAFGLVLTGMLSVAAVSTASAQHHGGGGGGGGFRGSGGFSFSRGGFGSRSSFGVSARASAIGGAVAYNRGGFYRPGFGYYGYPHLGFYLNVLPFGYYPFYWGDALYYYYGGVFYTPYDGGGYQVTTPPVGAAIPTLPEGARSIMIDNQQFYELNGVYYKTVVNDQGKKYLLWLVKMVCSILMAAMLPLPKAQPHRLAILLTNCPMAAAR